MKPTIIEKFRQSLARRFMGFRHPVNANVILWDKEHKGENVPPWDGKNLQKRLKREAHKIDRLAYIRYSREMFDGHVPKLKRIPTSVFE